MIPLCADSVAQTDLASITVVPQVRQAAAAPDWQTIYNYAGGPVLPPGTRLIAAGKWTDPTTRIDDKGVTFVFPELPDQSTASQPLDIGFLMDRPIAAYPTRITINYTSYLDQSVNKPWEWWSAFQLTTGIPNYWSFVSQMRGLGEGGITNLPFHNTGANTLVMNFDNKHGLTFTADDADGAFLLTDNAKDILKGTGAMLIPGFAIRNHMMQQPFNKGDWFTVNSFKIEQLRPPLEASSVAQIDLNVTGTQPIDTTIEVVDDHNDSHGFVLRDSPVAPGHYRLFWDGIDQKQSQPKNTAWIGAGNYTIHLTTSYARVHAVGEVNNSTPKYNYDSYGMVNCTSLAMTPPGTTPDPQRDQFYTDDKRIFDTTDSVQLTCVGYDAKQGQWICADGTLIDPKAGNPEMQCGRGLAVTPPDPADPKDATKQYYFCSKGIGNGDEVISCSLPANLHLPVAKKLTSPDWNRPPAGFMPYKVHLGEMSRDMLGQQHRLIFLTSHFGGTATHADWIFRNVRLYEDNMKDPGPVHFDETLFHERGQPGTNPPPAISPGSITIEDDGRSVHLKNAISVDYPFDYNITPHTILAFDVDVIDASGCNLGNGIGLSPETAWQDPDASRCINFLGQIADSNSQFGLVDPSLGAYIYPTYEPNGLYIDSIALPPPGSPGGTEATILWRPGFYGLKVSEDGHLLFACNNADNRLEVRDISTDGHAIAKIPIDDPMYVTWTPEGAEGAPTGVRYVYVDSASEGILRIPWNVADSKFGQPQRLTPASKFAYPRGLAYSAVDHRLFLCDSFTLDRSKTANQIVIIDPKTGEVLSRFGKKGGVDPRAGGEIDDHVFTLPLTIDADSKGALWVNDYYSCEVRKYNFDAATNDLKLERRVLGPNTTNTSHFYWMPGDAPTRVWTVGGFFVRNDADLDPDGRFVNPRATSTNFSPCPEESLRPYAHFEQIDGQVYGVFYDKVFQRVGDGWKIFARFGMGAGDVARNAGLLARPGEPSTELDKAIAASGDPNWAQRPWAWTDLDGDGKMSYSTGNPEFQIAFNSKVSFDGYIPPSACLRPEDAAYVHTAPHGLAVIPPTKFNGKLLYTWDNAKVVPRATDETASDVIAQDGRYFTLTESAGRHDVGDDIVNKIECYDESGKLLWTRGHDDYSLVCLQPLGNGLITVMDRGGWTTEGPVEIRTSDGDLVNQVYCRYPGDCWSNGVLRADNDTAYVGIVQAYKVTGLSTAKSATTSLDLSAAGN